MHEFIELVAAMRALQKSYFKTRQREVLIEARKLESQVDKWIAANESQLPGEPESPAPVQPSLFGSRTIR